MIGIRSWGIFCTVIFLTCFCSQFAEGKLYIGDRSKVVRSRREKSNGWLVCSFLIMWFMVAFTDSGVDYYNYYRIIKKITDFNDIFKGTIEPLFAFGSWLTMKLCNNPHVWLFILKTMTLCLIFKAFGLLKNDIDLSLAIFAYLAIIYPGSFYIIRQCFAAALLTLGFAYDYVSKGKQIMKPLICVIISVGFHTSSAIFLAGYLIYIVVRTSRERAMIQRIILLAIAGVLLFVSAGTVISSFKSMEIFEIYTDYLGKKTTYDGSGILQIVYYLPVFFTLFYLVKNGRINPIVVYGIVYTIMSFFCAQAGYYIPAFIRMRYYSIPCFCIIIPYFFSEWRKNRMGFDVSRVGYRIVKGVYVVFLIFRMYMTYSDLLAYGNNSQLYWYHSFWR